MEIDYNDSEYSLVSASLNLISSFAPQSCNNLKDLLAAKSLGHKLDQAVQADANYINNLNVPGADLATLYSQLIKAVNEVNKYNFLMEKNIFTNGLQDLKNSYEEAVHNWSINAYAHPTINDLNTGSGYFYAMQSSMVTFSKAIDINLNPQFLAILITIINQSQAAFNNAPILIEPTPMTPEQSELIAQLITLTDVCSSISVCQSFIPQIITARANIGLSMLMPNQMESITKLGPLLLDFGQAVNNYIDLLNFDNLLGTCTTDATESYINYL